MTVHIGPRHAVDPVTMVASQMAQKSSIGSRAQSDHRSRRGTGTRSRLHGLLCATKSDSASGFELSNDDRRAEGSADSTGTTWLIRRLTILAHPSGNLAALEACNTVTTQPLPYWVVIGRSLPQTLQRLLWGS